MFLIIIPLVILISCMIYYEVNQLPQYDYIYIRDQYYYLSNAPIDDTALGDPIGTVKRNTDIEKHQQNGDSNVLPPGTAIYALADMQANLAYPKNGRFYIAYRYIMPGETADIGELLS